MKVKEIRDMSDAELHQKVGELKEELFNLRFQMENPMRISEVRKNIARVKTIIRERELNINSG